MSDKVMGPFNFRYLGSFAQHYNLTIRYDTEISDVHSLQENKFHKIGMKDQHGKDYLCRYGTGLVSMNQNSDSMYMCISFLFLMSINAFTSDTYLIE